MLSIVVCKILENFMSQLISSINASVDYVAVPYMYESTCSRDVNLKKSKFGEWQILPSQSLKKVGKG